MNTITNLNSVPANWIIIAAVVLIAVAAAAAAIMMATATAVSETATALRCRIWPRRWQAGKPHQGGSGIEGA